MKTKSALLVIDVQNNVVKDAFKREEVIENINLAIFNARESNIEVIWVQHSDEELVVGSKNWEIVSELNPKESELKIYKKVRSSFLETNLNQELKSREISHLYIAGAQTNNCIRHTSHSAIDLGYDITLVADAHTTSSYEWNGRVISAEAVINEQNDNFYQERIGSLLVNTCLANQIPISDN